MVITRALPFFPYQPNRVFQIVYSPRNLDASAAEAQRLAMCAPNAALSQEANCAKNYGVGAIIWGSIVRRKLAAPLLT